MNNDSIIICSVLRILSMLVMLKHNARKNYSCIFDEREFILEPVYQKRIANLSPFRTESKIPALNFDRKREKNKKIAGRLRKFFQ